MAVTTVAIAGSTGSIGTQTIEVVQAEPDRFEVVALGAWSSADQLAAQATALHPKLVVIGDESRAGAVAAAVPAGTEVRAGLDALAELGEVADVGVNGVGGFAGLPVTLAAWAAGKRLALANKESLIAGGPVVREVLGQPGAGHIVPVDSEHCAVHMCLAANVSGRADRVARIVLTASGGPFRGRSRAELASVTVDDALAHPTWSMGPKITVDSATLMNKGLEVIEAFHLFPVGLDRLAVLVHPQSIVHSFVSYCDGSVLAQMGTPDMRTPIAAALAWPSRIATPVERLDLARIASLTFEAVDHQRFPAVQLCRAALQRGGSATTILNAANEVAVGEFLSQKLGFPAITALVEATLSRAEGDAMIVPLQSLEDVWAADGYGRRIAGELACGLQM